MIYNIGYEIDKDINKERKDKTDKDINKEIDENVEDEVHKKIKVILLDLILGSLIVGE